MIKLKTILTEVLEESLSSARKKYLDTKLIDQATFDKLKSFDPTPTFKYLEKIIEFYLESNPPNLEQVFKDYHRLHTKNQVKTRDVNKFKTFSDMSAEVESVNQTYSKKTAAKVKSKDAEVVFENDKWLVIIPRTFEASCKYGSGTKWCTTMDGGRHYRSYVNNGVTLYYIISKENPDDQEFGKMAVAVYPENSNDEFTTEDDDIIECFDAQDKPMDFYEILDITGLDENLFKSNPYELPFYEQLGLDESKITHNSDGSIDYDGNVNFNRNKRIQSINKIPIKFRKVSGNFACADCDLFTLENCPEEVGGFFDCSFNNLTTLKWCPKKIGGWFNCGKNRLTTLKGCVKEVKGNFHCHSNQLTSLEHGPKIVDGFFSCSDNPNLTSLRNCPRKVVDFHCVDTPKLPDSEKRWVEENIEARRFWWE